MNDVSPDVGSDDVGSDMVYAQMRLDAQLCFPLYAASRAVTRVYSTLLADLGLTYPQYLVMLVLWETPVPLSVGELGRRLHLDSGTLTPLLKRLEASGMVTRERSVTDERRVLVSLTEPGRRLREMARSVPPRLLEALGITEARAAELREELQVLLPQVDGRPEY